MANKLIQVKASGMMCSFCTMSVEKALKRLDGVENVQVNLVHGIILVEGDPARVRQEQVAKKVEELGYTVVATEAQQISTDEAIFSTIKRRGFLAMALAAADLLFDPLNLFSLPERLRAVASGVVAAVVLLWIGCSRRRADLQDELDFTRWGATNALMSYRRPSTADPLQYG